MFTSFKQTCSTFTALVNFSSMNNNEAMVEYPCKQNGRDGEQIQLVLRPFRSISSIQSQYSSFPVLQGEPRDCTATIL